MATSTTDCTSSWSEVPTRIRAGEVLPEPWENLFGPLRTTSPDGSMVVGQIGQSLDGRIATLSGHCDISGSAGLDHLHRLRSVVDAVVVGAGTVRADNPQLTVRRVSGPSPARVAIDPRTTIDTSARICAPDGVRRITITVEQPPTSTSQEVEKITLPLTGTLIDPSAILAALFARGLRRVLIEGGPRTISHFLAAGCLDRLHVMVAPLILGSGLPSLALPPIARVTDALRVPIQTHRIHDEVLFDCDLSDQRAAGAQAKIS